MRPASGELQSFPLSAAKIKQCFCVPIIALGYLLHLGGFRLEYPWFYCSALTQ